MQLCTSEVHQSSPVFVLFYSPLNCSDDLLSSLSILPSCLIFIFSYLIKTHSVCVPDFRSFNNIYDCFPSFVSAKGTFLSNIINAQSHKSSKNIKSLQCSWYLNPFHMQGIYLLKHCLTHDSNYHCCFYTKYTYTIMTCNTIFKNMLLDTFKQSKASQLIDCFIIKFTYRFPIHRAHLNLKVR